MGTVRIGMPSSLLKNYIIRFKRVYNKAVKDNQLVFKFDGQEVLVTYGKYHLQYLEGVLNERKARGL